MNEILSLINPWWFGKKFPTGIERPGYIKRLLASSAHKRAVLLTGSRRVGKTTLLYQLIAKLLGQKINPHHILYLLMDHPQLQSMSILDLVKEFRVHFDLKRKTKIYLFLDEVQYSPNWEQEIKALLDVENIKIFLSGSASSQLILKSHYLTGRLEKIEVFPLDFNEFLLFKKVNIEEIEVYRFSHYLDEYLKIGGYPEYALKKDISYFTDLINGILFKDIVDFYRLKNPQALMDLVLLLADRVGHRLTYAKLARVLSLNLETVKEYIFYLKNTFLIDELPRFSPSRAARIYGPKKFYFRDNGILFNLLGKLSFGQAFEQMAFNFLQRKYNIGFYYEKQKEVDFALRINGEIQLWEAKYEVDEKNLEESLLSYLKIAQQLKVKKVVLLTKDFEKKIRKGGLTISCLPLWKLLCNN